MKIRAPRLRGALLAQNNILSGNYVHIPQSLAEHTWVRVILQTSKSRSLARNPAPGKNGIGIQFTNGITVKEWKSLETIIL